jgi:hypothetical protein
MRSQVYVDEHQSYALYVLGFHDMMMPILLLAFCGGQQWRFGAYLVGNSSTRKGKRGRKHAPSHIRFFFMHIDDHMMIQQRGI